MKKSEATSVGSVVMAVLAFVASQHHTIHMLMMSVGVGTAGITFMRTYPTIRRVMLALSVVMAFVSVVQALRAQGHRRARVVSWVSASLTLGLVVWSVVQYGL